MRILAIAVALCGFSNGIAAEPTTVPLTEILTTSGQEGLRDVSKEFSAKGIHAVQNKATKNLLDSILNAGPCGASSVFLVSASDVNEAIQASANVLAGSHSTDLPTPTKDPGHWMVAYLGVGPGSPPRWTVESVNVSRSIVRLSYREPPAGIRTSNMLSYYYWAPLGKLEPGTYQVELYDADEKAVTLMRRVVVEHQQ